MTLRSFLQRGIVDADPTVVAVLVAAVAIGAVVFIARKWRTRGSR